MKSSRWLLLAAVVLPVFASADAIRQTKNDHYDAFRQLGVDLPTPNMYRGSSGAPGPQYWQQRADYKIDVTLDEDNRRITASETISYTNHSPDTLRYIWLQLDQNRFRDDSAARTAESAANPGSTADIEQRDIISYGTLAREQSFADNDHGHEILNVTDSRGRPMRYTIVDTMMRIDLAAPLQPGQKNTFSVDWAFNIIDYNLIGGRNGYDHFTESDTYIYFLAQWFPRLVAYTDYAGWQHHQFLGSGEFTLEFGDYEVAITVPEDHIVSSTGALQNESRVLSSEQRQRMADARSADKPVFIVTPDEAMANEQGKSSGSKTWVFKAENVRDFAWSSSRKFIWDAMIHRQDGADHEEVLAMSFYPNEAMPIWSMYSTEAVVHTMDVYSRFSFDYPYPTAQSVNTWSGGGMEYPMITFNGRRPELIDPEDDTFVEDAPDRTYSRRVKYGLINVIIHEVGHIYFPMTVNSDERQWTWMDEGINSFLEYLAELEWEEEHSTYGDDVNVLDNITEYMAGQYQVPIMTQSDSVWRLGPNAYTKPTAALVILRETVMGRDLFDFAFKEYSRRWKFKRPTPADFFRTMEDASGVDLDWFWRGWFYSTDHVDIAISGLREYKISSLDPDVEYPLQREEHQQDVPETLGQVRNREEGRETRLQKNPELGDFYNENDRFTVSNTDRNHYQDTLEGLEDWERAALQRAVDEDKFVYFVDFENIGGLVSPLPLLITNEGGSQESIMLPAEIWRRNNQWVSKMMIRDTAIRSIDLDPEHRTADADFSNNQFPSRIQRSRIELYKNDNEDRDLMRDMLQKLRDAKGDAGDSGSEVPLEPTG
jgi:hypothetical protein